MTAPRLEIDLAGIGHNARALVGRLAARGIAVTGVTKATLGSPEVARVLRASGVAALGDSRIENLEALRRAGLPGPLTLIRSPMPSQAARVVATADRSLNSEPEVLAALAAAATRAGVRHGVVLMVELGDLREGVLPGDLVDLAALVRDRDGLDLVGIGTNLACQSGATPDAGSMDELSALADRVERTLGVRLPVVSGGNSANLAWALGGADPGRVDDLRLGEAILLGTEPMQRTPIEGLRTDAFTLVAEVIESRRKPSQPWGTIGQAAYGTVAPMVDRGERVRTIVALGRQDVDPAGLLPPAGVEVLGASSDHLVLDTGDRHLAPGTEVAFGLTYGALVAAMTSPFVARAFSSPESTGTRRIG